LQALSPIHILVCPFCPIHFSYRYCFRWPHLCSSHITTSMKYDIRMPIPTSGTICPLQYSYTKELMLTSVTVIQLNKTHNVKLENHHTQYGTFCSLCCLQTESQLGKTTSHQHNITPSKAGDKEVLL
jgi:hypothetical protein